MKPDKREFQEMMTIKEVTLYLKISRQYLHQLTREGQISCYKLGKAVRYRRDDIEEYLQKRKQ